MSTLIISFTTFANQDHAYAEAQKFLEERNEVYFSFEKPDITIIKQIFNIVSIDEVTHKQIIAYANPGEFKRFLEFNIDFEVLPPPGFVDFDLNMLSWEELKHRDLTESWDFYPTYEAYVTLMYQFQEDHPDLVEIINIGQSVMGRDLLFARISPELDQDRAVPQFMYTSTMHGDEVAGFILSLRLIHYLITNYGIDDEITHLMNSVDIYICPNENPDGTYTNDNSTVLGATRGNAYGVDLNRNYPNPVNDPWDDQQPETTVMINYTQDINFIMSANMHGGIELVNYPFDSWTSSQNTHADHNWWEFVMYEYVDTVHAHSPTGYMTGMGDGVTHGGDWYVVYGSRQDYFNYYKSCREFTLELSNQKILNPALLPAHWEYNYRSLLNYIRQATYGVHGLVYDNQTGDPVYTQVSIPGYDKDGSEVYTSLPNGNYNRPLLAGTYNMRYTASEYTTININNVAVNNYQTTRLNIAMGDDVTNDIVNVVFETHGQGEIMPFSGEQLFNKGANLFISAEAANDWVFENWEINGNVFHEPEIVYNLQEDTEVKAFFAPLDLQPVIVLNHEELHFGQGVIGIAQSKNLWIKNDGDDVLEITSLFIEGDDVFYLTDPAKTESMTIEPGNEVPLAVYFQAAEEQQYSGTLFIESNDPENPQISVPLSGTGVLEAAIIQFSIDIIDFGDVVLNESASEAFIISNIGNVSLTLMPPAVPDDSPFNIYAPDIDWPLVLEPGQHQDFEASFYAAEAGYFIEELIFVSTAGNEPEFPFIMRGTGVTETLVDNIAGYDWQLSVYPNPIREHSQLLIETEHPGNVRIAVYDLQGREVHVLYNGMLNAAGHQFGLSPIYNKINKGIYFLVVSTGNKRETLRLIKM